jgi:hypothetical protein
MDREAKYVADLVKNSKLFSYPELDRKPTWKLETGKDGKKKIIKINKNNPYVREAVNKEGYKFVPGDMVWLDVGDDCVPVQVMSRLANKYMVKTEEGLKKEVDQDLLLGKIEI